MRLRLIACEVFTRELCAAISASPHEIDVEFLPKGLHSRPAADMQAAIQQRIDCHDGPPYDAIILGFGLCNHGTQGLGTQHIPLVMAKAHDCITLFMGSRQRYDKYFKDHPGSYF